MRKRALLSGDIRFQYKYGFYFIYLVFSLVYLGILFSLPAQWRETAAIVMIFTDPAAMGLFFMGAIVLFEKSERVLNSIAVSPVMPYEYVISKLVSIGVISVLVSLVLGIAGGVVSHPLRFAAGVFLCSCLFSGVGLVIACRIATLNQFILATIPAEILIILPAIFYLFGYRERLLLLHPGACLMEVLVRGEYAALSLLLLFLWTALFVFLSCLTVQKMLKSVGGITL